MTEKKDLEILIEKKVKPLIEDATKKFTGVTISELNKSLIDKLEKPFLFDVNTNYDFKTAKKNFKKQFLTYFIEKHGCNISEVSKFIGLDRRSIHRSIQEFRIDVIDLKKNKVQSSHYKELAVSDAVKDVLGAYKTIIHPEKLQKMYEYAPILSSEIAKEMPDIDSTWKEAEENFEREYLKKALTENNFDLGLTSKKIKLRYETLIRKIHKLGIR